jgi:hypothetical protein
MWLALRLFAFGVVPSLVLVLTSFQFPARWSSTNDVYVAALLVPTMLLLILPLPLFYIAAFPPRDRTLPAVGLAAAALAAALVVAGWVVPEANQQLRKRVWSASLQRPPGDRMAFPERGLNELRPHELITSAWSHPAGPEMFVLIRRTGHVALSTVLVLLGVAVSVLPQAPRRRWLLVGPAVFWLAWCCDFVYLKLGWGHQIARVARDWPLRAVEPLVYGDLPLGLVPWIAAGIGLMLFIRLSSPHVFRTPTG